MKNKNEKIIIIATALVFMTLGIASIFLFKTEAKNNVKITKLNLRAEDSGFRATYISTTDSIQKINFEEGTMVKSGESKVLPGSLAKSKEQSYSSSPDDSFSLSPNGDYISYIEKSSDKDYSYMAGGKEIKIYDTKTGTSETFATAAENTIIKSVNWNENGKTIDFVTVKDTTSGNNIPFSSIGGPASQSVLYSADIVTGESKLVRLDFSKASDNKSSIYGDQYLVKSKDNNFFVASSGVLYKFTVNNELEKVYDFGSGGIISSHFNTNIFIAKDYDYISIYNNSNGEVKKISIDGNSYNGGGQAAISNDAKYVVYVDSNSSYNNDISIYNVATKKTKKIANLTKYGDTLNINSLKISNNNKFLLMGYTLDNDDASMVISLDEAITTPQEINVSLGYSGTGIVVEYGSINWQIKEVFAGSPAEKSGIKTGDEIVSVNGQSVKRKTLEEITSLLRGSAGTTVRVTTGDNIEHTITRGAITTNSNKIEEDYGWIF